MNKLRVVFVVSICTVITLTSFWLLAFGMAVFCCAPTYPGQSFWKTENFYFGLLPLSASIAVLAFACRVWALMFVRRRNAWLCGCIFACSCIALDLTLFWKQRGHGDDGIEVTWKRDSGVFDWGKGQIRLPAGFTYQSDLGMDTFIGHFTSKDGKIVIEHDIGEFAGEHGRGMGRSETLKEGSRVRIARVRSEDKGHTTFFVRISFPDNGCANFFLESSDENDAAAIDFVAWSFRPNSRTPPWLRPLLPEVLRSDCRYQFIAPFGF